MKRNEIFGNFKKNNINKVIKYINLFDKFLQQYYNFGYPFFKGNYSFNYYEYLKNKNLNEKSKPIEEVFDYISPLFQNMPNWLNPGTMINVIPPGNLISVATSTMINLYNPNYGQDTYSGYLHGAEMETIKYLSDLIGWNWENTCGIFTFGGKATSLYGTKVALNKADINIRLNGVYQKRYFMITSETCHPCHFQVCDWLGIGSENCLIMPVTIDGRINIEYTEKIISEKISKGYVFLGFNLNGGSTNELTIDPIDEIYDLSVKIKEKFNLNYRPHIHVDGVIGWASLFFNNYDFNNNPLKINKKHLNKIKSLNKRARKFVYADSIGIDFHKTGFSSFVSSVFITKERKDYYLLNPDKEKELKNINFGNHNPFDTSLELSRSGQGALSALVILKTLGVEGFQKLISNLFSSAEYLREKLSKVNKITIINKETEGFATLFFIKPEKYINYSYEDLIKLDDKNLAKIREYNIGYSKYILNLALNNKISFIYTSSRSYTLPNTNIKIGALKAYPMSPVISKREINRIFKEIIKTIEDYELIHEKIYYNKSLSDDMVYGQGTTK